MTEAMNFFQLIPTFRSSAPRGASREEINLAISLKSEARSLAFKADEEMCSGRTTKALALEAQDKDKIRVFAEIAVWHHDRAAEKYRRSAERFAEAARIQTGKGKALNLMAKELMRRAGEAQAAVVLLNEFIKQNKI
jgi:hypothetical protein